MSIFIDRLDHLVLTVGDIPSTVRFYTLVLGMNEIHFGAGRIGLQFGNQKINLHEVGHEFEPKAERPTPGSADLCFITVTPIQEVTAHLSTHNIPIVQGPVRRTGAMGDIESVYIRDPDNNLIEISNYL